MPGRIKISNLKGIVSFDYEIPGPGLHLLSGANGSGKTTLLACLRRIGYRNAFPVHFVTSTQSEQLDNYSNASIEYSINGRSVVYGYRRERWTPRPRSGAALLQDFGFPNVIYAGSVVDRVTPSAQDFVPARVRPATPELISSLNRVFETQKFNDLKVVNLTRGAGNQAYLMRVGRTNPTKYHTEKNFGLGELCVLKLMLSLQNCPNNSLVLIDELEMALHPMAQIKFVEYLKEISDQKNLTTVVSTHSASLIKYFGKRHLNFLVKDGTDTKVLKNCFPTYALGQLGFGEERAPDYLVYVEDKAARRISEILWQSLVVDRLGARAAYAPTVHFVEIGGINNVLNMIVNGGGLVPEQTQVWALLDLDAKTETLQQAINSGNLSAQQLFATCDPQLKYLPWSPEVGIIQYLSAHHGEAQQALRLATNTAYLRLPQPTHEELIAAAGGPQRRAAKNGLNRICTETSAALPNLDASAMKDLIYKVFSEWSFNAERPQIQALFGPFF
jgi:energy-coupling factor transporter ATP-binding protein EcfA2